jgi:DNA replication protein DnaC
MKSIREMETGVKAALTEAAKRESTMTHPITASPCECGDTGFVLRDGRAQRCVCRYERIIRYQLPERFHQAKLEDFSPQIARLVHGWMLEPTDGLLLIGGVGTGKTHLAAAMVRSVVTAGKSIRFRRAAQLYQAIRDSYDQPNVSEEEVLSDYIDAPLLVLDDLGTGSFSDHERRYTLEVLDRRLNEKRPTIITSNWTLDDISARMDQRIASRMSGFTRLELKGEDKRKRKTA